MIVTYVHCTTSCLFFKSANTMVGSILCWYASSIMCSGKIPAQKWYIMKDTQLKLPEKYWGRREAADLTGMFDKRVSSQQLECVDLKQDWVEQQLPGCWPLLGVLLQAPLDEVLTTTPHSCYSIYNSVQQCTTMCSMLYKT